jgi:hypothetical protein
LVLAVEMREGGHEEIKLECAGKSLTVTSFRPGRHQIAAQSDVFRIHRPFFKEISISINEDGKKK